MQREEITRRRFVVGTAAAAMIVPRHVLGGQGRQAPSDRLNIAVIGAGGQGTSDAVELVTGGENIVALADVDFGHVDQGLARRIKDREGKPIPAFVKLQEAYAKAKRYSDYRRMLEEQKDINAVLVDARSYSCGGGPSRHGVREARLCGEAADVYGL